MASKYWLKLYHEMLDDPKVAKLPDSSWRRFVECLLLAGEVDKSGFLPDVPDMAWRLRLNDNTLSQDLSRLALSGLVELKNDGESDRWFVTNFSKRQGASAAAERMRAYRRRKNQKREDEILDTDTDIDTYRDVTSSVTGVTFRNVFEAYHNEIGSLTPIISDTLTSWEEDTSTQWVVDAICIASMNNVRNFAYIKAILERWMSEGKQSFDKPSSESKSGKAQKETAAERIARLDKEGMLS